MGNAISRGAGSSSVCSLQTGTVIFITVQVFFPQGLCHKAVWVCVTVPKCCVSPVIGRFVFLYAQSSSAGARAEAVGPAK